MNVLDWWPDTVVNWREYEATRRGAKNEYIEMAMHQFERSYAHMTQQGSRRLPLGMCGDERAYSGDYGQCVVDFA